MDILKHIKVLISEDGMEARLCLSTEKQDDDNDESPSFSVGVINEILNFSKVSFGILPDVIEMIVNEQKYNQFITVAKGSPMINGTNGAFTFHFRTELENKPKVNEDGSIDYRNVDRYEPVSYGQEVVTYTKATKGVNGMTVHGTQVNAVPGKDLPTLKGKGFILSEDGLHYISQMNGKIEYNFGVLTITNLLDINGDVDYTTGDIEFDGDVLVHGSVMMGATIHAGGNLNIIGNVEGAELVAGGDITLKNGMQGSGKGSVKCSGSCWGKFFEQTTIDVDGDLHANSVLNCDIYCKGSAYISGKHGLVVGGSIIAQGNIEVTSAGNMAEVKTKLCAGANEQLLAELDDIDNRIHEIQEQIKKANQVKEKLDAIKSPTDAEKYSLLVKQVNDSLESYRTQFYEINKDREEKAKIIAASSSSKIVVNKYLYPNVSLTINGVKSKSNATWVNVLVKDIGGQLQIMNNA